MKKIEEKEKEKSSSELIPANSFLEVFKYRQFVRNYIKFDQNLVLAYKATFGDDGTAVGRIIKKAAAILEKSQVQLELQALLPTDQELTDVIKKAIGAPVPAVIGWGDKHRFMETALELKGHINKKELGGITNNVVMFVKE